MVGWQGTYKTTYKIPGFPMSLLLRQAALLVGGVAV